MRPSERLSAIFLLALAAAAALSRPAAAGVLVAAFLGLAAAVAALARAGGRGPGWALARDLSPIALVLVAFMLLQPVIEAVNGARWDATLAALDARRLAPLVRAWRAALGRPAWFTDAVYVAYLSFYAFLVAVALAVRARRPGAYERTVFDLLFCFYLTWAGYFLFPTLGPRLPPDAEALVVGGGAVGEAARAFLRVAERTTLDTFPSGHTASSIVAAVAGVRALPRLAPVLLAWAGAIVFATVYLHVHYAVDVLAGVAVAAASVAVAPAAARALSSLPRPRAAAREG